MFRYQPRTGTWSDWEVVWNSGYAERANRVPEAVFRPCVDGGVYSGHASGSRLAADAEHLGTQSTGDPVESRWRLTAGDVSGGVTYRFRFWNKSLVIDVTRPRRPRGRSALRSRRGPGRNPRLVTNPFYPAEGGRPAVVVSGAERRRCCS